MPEANSTKYSDAVNLFNGNFDYKLIQAIDPYLISLGTENSHILSSQLDSFNFIPSINELELLTNTKNNFDTLISIFPSMEESIEDVDVWSRYYEESLQYVESTPDVKLYYPEPFIASPSFVHEEL